MLDRARSEEAGRRSSREEGKMPTCADDGCHVLRLGLGMRWGMRTLATPLRLGALSAVMSARETTLRRDKSDSIDELFHPENIYARRSSSADESERACSRLRRRGVGLALGGHDLDRLASVLLGPFAHDHPDLLLLAVGVRIHVDSVSVFTDGTPPDLFALFAHELLDGAGLFGAEGLTGRVSG